MALPSISSSVSVAMIKTATKSNLGGKGFIWLTSYSPIIWEVRAGTQGPKQKLRSELGAILHLLSLGYSASSFPTYTNPAHVALLTVASSSLLGCLDDAGLPC